MTGALLVIISCKDKIQAEQIGRHLLTNRLAACVQVVDRVESMYLWPPGQNHIETGSESLLLVKTLKTKWTNLEKEVKKIHSYENPEIIATTLTYVTKSYLDWMNKELK